MAIGSVAFAGCTLVSPAVVTHTENDAETCHNERDDDWDGRRDCRDEDCVHECVEASAARCDDDRDDDGDTLVDCDDPDCAGHCPERELSACANERDDDGDGRIDALDPECWPFCVAEIERCASVLGGTLEVMSAHLDGTFDLIADPTGRFPGEIAATAGRPNVAGRPVLVPWAWSTQALAGAIEGTEASFTFHTGVAGGAVGLGELTLERALESSITVSVRPGPPPAGGVIVLLDVEVAGQGASQDMLRLSSLAAGWIEVSLRVEGGVVTAVVRWEGSTIANLTAPLVAGFPAAAPMRVVVEGSAIVGQAPSLFGSATVRRRDFERCGARTPPFGVTSEPVFAGAFAWSELDHLVRGEPGTLCALGATRSDPLSSELPGYYSYLSTDDGASWTRSAELVSVPLGGVVFGALGYDAGDRRWHALLVRQSASGSGFFQAESADCEHWRLDELGIDPSDGGRFDRTVGPLDYRVRDGEHVATFGMAEVGGTIGLVELRSPWGFPGSWVWSDTLDPSIFGELPPPGDTRTLGIRFFDVGRDEVAVVNDYDGEIGLWVRGDDADWRRVPGFVLGPSGEPASFDAHVVLFGSLVEDAPEAAWWRGRLYYGGLFDAESRGWGWANVRIGLPSDG